MLAVPDWRGRPNIPPAPSGVRRALHAHDRNAGQQAHDEHMLQLQLLQRQWRMRQQHQLLQLRKRQEQHERELFAQQQGRLQQLSYIQSQQQELFAQQKRQAIGRSKEQEKAAALISRLQRSRRPDSAFASSTLNSQRWAESRAHAPSRVSVVSVCRVACRLGRVPHSLAIVAAADRRAFETSMCLRASIEAGGTSRCPGPSAARLEAAIRNCTATDGLSCFPRGRALFCAPFRLLLQVGEERAPTALDPSHLRRAWCNRREALRDPVCVAGGCPSPRSSDSASRRRAAASLRSAACRARAARASALRSADRRRCRPSPPRRPRPKTPSRASCETTAESSPGTPSTDPTTRRCAETARPLPQPLLKPSSTTLPFTPPQRLLTPVSRAIHALQTLPLLHLS
eukprot:5054433-Pleurochrysis_carterae.AAC.1